MGEGISEVQVESLLSLAINHYNEYLGDNDHTCREEDDDAVPIFSVQTFEEAGLLTTDKGVVLSFEDEHGFRLGEFQVRIVRSR